MVYKALLLMSLNLLVACSSLATDTENYVVISDNPLPEELKESSGLFCPQAGSAFTLNDSGNPSDIYQVDSLGVVIDRQALQIRNIDWEALTGDNKHFYIGDVGNNRGKREFVQIHIIPRQSSSRDLLESQTTTLKVSYKNNLAKSNEYLDHDYDAEALINLDDNLYLFSKSWNTGTLFIYRLDKDGIKQVVEPSSQIEGLPGIITGGDYDQKNNRYVLVGYQVEGMGDFYPFIVLLNRDLTLDKVFSLAGYGQVEGVCVAPNGEVWFTQESSFFSDHKIVRLRLKE